MGVIQRQQLRDHLLLGLPPRHQVLERGHVQGHHVLQDPTPDTLGGVAHGTVLDGPGEHDDVSRLGGQLDGVLEKLIGVLRVLGVDVGAGDNSGGPVLRVEVGEKRDHLEGEEVAGRQVHAALLLRPKVAVVGVVEVGLLAQHAGQNGVGGKA